MKKILLLSTVILIFSLTASAQIKKGSILLGGQLTYNTSKISWNTSQPSQKNKSATISISAGKAVKDNSVLGFYGSYGHSKSDNYYNGNLYGNLKFDYYRAGIFYRKYKKLAKDFYFFGETGGGYLGSHQVDTDLSGNKTTTYYQSGAELYLTPGISYRLYKKLHVELLIPQIAGIQYSVTKTSTGAGISKQDQFQFNSSLNSSLLSNLGLGFRLIL